MSTNFLTHGRIKLALHQLRGGEGQPLLLLHPLGERSPSTLTGEESAWPGPVYALDFTGHGGSTVPRGGGYHPEVLMADADAALAELGSATILGRGLGGYVGVMLSGGRPREVRGVIVCDGRGLAGGGAEPHGPRILAAPPPNEGAPADPFALVELSTDVRPPDYVAMFVRLAEARSGLAHAITVAATERPAWLYQLLAEPGVTEGTVAEGIARYSSRTLRS